MGSVTVDAVLCDSVGLLDRQLVQVRNETTGVDLWTYVIYGRRSPALPPGTLCLNGAAAHLVSVGHIVSLVAWATIPDLVPTLAVRSWDSVAFGLEPPRRQPLPASWAAGAIIEVAVGKVHRPRLTAVKSPVPGSGDFPSVSIDRDWAAEAGIAEGRAAHVVNVTTGQRDVLPVLHAPSGSRQCVVTVAAAEKQPSGASGALPGHFLGDIVIVMCYSSMLRSRVCAGDIPPIKIAFPFEGRAESGSGEEVASLGALAADVFWDQKRLAEGLVSLLDLGKPGLRVLDCSAASFAPAVRFARRGVQICIARGDSVVAKRCRDELIKVCGPDHGVQVRCLNFEGLRDEYGTDAFDVIIARGDVFAHDAGQSELSRDGYVRMCAHGRCLFDLLAPSGRLYVDCLPLSEDALEFENRAELSLDGMKTNINVRWVFVRDEKRSTRRWEKNVSLKNDGIGCINSSLSETSVLVCEQELMSILTYSGFGLVERSDCDGEDVYQPFVATKLPIRLNGHSEQACQSIPLPCFGNVGEAPWGMFCDSLTAFEVDTQVCFRREAKGSVPCRPLQAVQALMASKLGQTVFDFLLIVGFTSIWSIVETARDFNNIAFVGCNAIKSNQMKKKVATALETEFGASCVTFSTRSAREFLNEDTGATFQYTAAFSETTLCRLLPADRACEIEAISCGLGPDGMFVFNDVVCGPNRIRPTTRLHFFGRLNIPELWTPVEYIQSLECSGLEIVEYQDITRYMVETHSTRSQEASEALDKLFETDASYNTLSALARGYRLSAEAGARGEVGWGLFVCKKNGAP